MSSPPKCRRAPTFRHYRLCVRLQKALIVFPDNSPSPSMDAPSTADRLGWRGNRDRFKANENHRISKQIVEKATDTKRGIGLEDLTGIRERTRFRKTQRDKMSKWSFAELRGFIEYKAKLAGVPVIPVDPRNTSRTCPKCGHIDEGNRTARGLFLCRSCGHFDHADIVGATNIATAAKVAWREVAEKRLTAAA